MQRVKRCKIPGIKPSPTALTELSRQSLRDTLATLDTSSFGLCVSQCRVWVLHLLKDVSSFAEGRSLERRKSAFTVTKWDGLAAAIFSSCVTAVLLL